MGAWCLLEWVRPAANPKAEGRPEPLGILFVDSESGRLTLRLRESSSFEELEEQETDILDFLGDDLLQKAEEQGAEGLLRSLEDSLSHSLRIGERTAIEYTGSAQRAADRLFDRHVDGEVRPGVTHLPLYGLRAAATKFGEGMDSEFEEWVRIPAGFRVKGNRVKDDLFVAHVVGRSMEPLIPDGSLCVFRAGVTGSRQGKLLLIEKFGETDFASRYTIKRYTSRKKVNSDGDWEHERIRLEPLNPEFEAFELGPDEFRAVAEFVEVLD
jgi:phage repressor protein C with HTH and peptisase S24 domain